MPEQNPTIEDKFEPIRKGLLEFAVLTVIASKKVYAADILAILNATEFITQEGTDRFCLRSLPDPRDAVQVHDQKLPSGAVE